MDLPGTVFRESPDWNDDELSLCQISIVLEDAECATVFCKENRPDTYLDAHGGIGVVLRVAEYPLFSVSHFPESSQKF